MMKRIVSLALVLVMVAALFVGCGLGSPAGTYKIKTVDGKSFKEYICDEYGIDEDDYDEYEDEILDELDIKNLDEAVLFELKDNGKMKITYMGEKMTGTWELDGSDIILEIDGDEVEGEYKGGKITLDIEGEEWVLAKK